MSADREAAERIHQSLQDNAKPECGDIVGDVVLTGWAIVVEWMDHDGQRFLTRMHQPDGTLWQAKGFWHEALNGDWPAPDDD